MFVLVVRCAPLELSGARSERLAAAAATAGAIASSARNVIESKVCAVRRVAVSTSAPLESGRVNHFAAVWRALQRSATSRVSAADRALRTTAASIDLIVFARAHCWWCAACAATARCCGADSVEPNRRQKERKNVNGFHYLYQTQE